MKNQSLNAKIYFVLSIFIFACIVISTMGLVKMGGIKEALDDIVNGPVIRRVNANRLNNAFSEQQIFIRNLVLSETLEDRNERKKLYDEGIKTTRSLQSIALNGTTPAGKSDVAEFLVLFDKWTTLNEPVIKNAFEGNIKEAAAIMRSNREIRGVMDKLIQNEIDRSAEDIKYQDTKSDQDFSSAKMMMIATSIIAIFSGLVLAYFILKAVGNSINQVISSLTENSEQVSSAAKQIASSSQELSEAATEQASSLEQTAASIQEMSSMVQKNAENAKRTSDLASTSNDTAAKGKSVVTDMMKSIDDISMSNTTIMNQIDESNQKISDIVKVIAEIGNKTKVINDIVFQTKLLSFNASVEAARAGEHGKGFAVVAEEVGNLAQMSGNAAKEITSMLEGSIQKVEGIVSETKQKVGTLIVDGRNKIDIGSRIAKDCGLVLDEIVENFSSVSEMANEISTACLEQAQGVQEITKAMSQLDQVTQTNAATSEEAASAAEELSAQSESLHDTVAVLVKTIKGSNGENFRRESSAVQTFRNAKQEKFGSNVVKFKKSTPKHSNLPTRKAVGSFEGSMPSEHDPRFEEV